MLYQNKKNITIIFDHAYHDQEREKSIMIISIFKRDFDIFNHARTDFKLSELLKISTFNHILQL